MRFDNSYLKLPSHFYTEVSPTKVPEPQLIVFNKDLAEQLELVLDPEKLAQIFSGQILLEGSHPISTVYAGHQFGHFVPQLGDGRAILLGEVVNSKDQRFDIQLKGAGITPYSRNGDGKAVIGPVIREYIVSEAMYRLGVPTTRALAVVSTGELIQRDQLYPGAILTRVASNHIRIGHFEYFAARGDKESLKTLLDYTVERHFPELKNDPDKKTLFLRKNIELQADLIAQWMGLGFIHGVMNTDNMSVAGLTIDYGPCAFMDTYNNMQVFSSIDRHGRYAYANQPSIALWNLSRLADCLLVAGETKEKLEAELIRFEDLFAKSWLKRMKNKLGIFSDDVGDLELVNSWLDYLQEAELDFTLSFRELSRLADSNISEFFKTTSGFKKFLSHWQKRLKEQNIDLAQVKDKINQVNPVYIPRNHQVERAIRQAIAGDYSVFKGTIEVLKKPFTPQLGFEAFEKAPLPDEIVERTFCGT